jgi:branched-chain amino acid transport system substrate-binding protein
MALGGGYQVIQDTAIGKTRYDAAKQMVVLEDIQRFPAECVYPPPNMKSEEWNTVRTVAAADARDRFWPPQQA